MLAILIGVWIGDASDQQASCNTCSAQDTGGSQAQFYFFPVVALITGIMTIIGQDCIAIIFGIITAGASPRPPPLPPRVPAPRARGRRVRAGERCRRNVPERRPRLTSQSRAS